VKSQDEIDTAPVLPREDARTEYAEIYVDPGEERELVLCPDCPMRDPLLITSSSPRDVPVAILQIACGPFVLPLAPRDANEYRFGRPVETVVSSKEPLKILFRNCGRKKVKIAVSLVDTTESKEHKIDTAGIYQQIDGRDKEM